jgi:hypothetical protein
MFYNKQGRYLHMNNDISINFRNSSIERDRCGNKSSNIGSNFYVESGRFRVTE